MITVEGIRAPIQNKSALDALLGPIPHPPTVGGQLKRPFFGRRWSVASQCDHWLSSDGEIVVCVIIHGATSGEITRIRSAYDALHPERIQSDLLRDFVDDVVSRIL